MKCFYCSKSEDVRPYGPKGSMVCFDCAMSSTERKAEAASNFASQLDASGPVAVVDGTYLGPYPMKPGAN